MAPTNIVHSKTVQLVAGGLLLFIAGFGTALVSRPARVEYHHDHDHDHTETVKDAQQLNVDELVQKLTKQLSQIQQHNNVTTHTETVKQPDGTTITKQDVVDKTDTDTHNEVTAQVTDTVKAQLQLFHEQLVLDHDHDSVSKVTTYAKPNYRLVLNVGYDFASLWGRGGDFNLVPLHGLLAQLQLEKRLFGPVFGVLWAQSNGAAGVGAGVEW